MTLIFKYLKQIWLPMILLLALTVIATFTATSRPLAIAGVIDLTLDRLEMSDRLNKSYDSNVSDANLFDLNQSGSIISDFILSFINIEKGVNDFVPHFIAIILFLSILTGIIQYTASALNSFLRSDVIRKIRTDFVDSLLGLGLSFFNRIRSGDLIARTVEESRAAGLGIVSVSHRILHSALLIVVYFIFLINTSFDLTLGILIIVIFHYLLSAILKKPIRKFVTKDLEATASLTASLQEVFSNIRLIQSYPNSELTNNNLHNSISNASKAYFNNQLISGIEPEARYILDGVAEALILVLAIYQLFSGNIQIQGFLLYVYVARLVLGPVKDFSTYFVWLQRIYAATNRLKEYYRLDSDIKDGEIRKESFEKNIELNNISFSYKDRLVLSDLDFSIEKDNVIAIVGKSGSGKSTLVDLILRFYDPISGEIFLDGENIKNLKLNSYRELFGIVSQEVFLLNDSIESNVCFGRNLEKIKLKEACEIANAHEFILELPDGYQTNIGDRGVRLSGGQRQRLSIARAIYGNPEILVLDEATSSLDSDSERKVQKGIEKALFSRTAIIVAHRLSTIQYADKIIVLEKGKIQAIGNHNELIENSSTYSSLYSEL